MAHDLVSNNVRALVKGVVHGLDVKNYTIDVSPGSVHGDNYMGIISKVVISGQDKNGKNKIINLIVKSAPQNEAFRSVTPIRAAYEREIYIYSKVFPEMAKLQAERGVPNPFNSHPIFYRSTMAHMNEAIIMGDMKVLEFELRDRHISLNINHVSMVMKEYGRLHALSFALRKHKPEVFKEISCNAQENFFLSFSQSEVMKKAVGMHCDRALQALDSVEDKIVYEKLGRFKGDTIDIIRKVLDSNLSGEYSVIGHGDSWVNNMLFKYKDNSKPDSPSQVCLLDWQLARVGSPALDLSYFIFACTDKPLRDKYYDYLIKEYYNSLSSFLRELGCDPEELFPFSVLQEHLKKFCIYGLYMAFMVIHLMTSDSDEIPDIHTITDINKKLEEYNFKSKNIKKYNERVRGVIVDFDRFGYDFGI